MGTFNDPWDQCYKVNGWMGGSLDPGDPVDPAQNRDVELEPIG